MVVVDDATLTYGRCDEPSLHDVSLSVTPGQAVLVCGESGCGKTSLTRLINGLAVHFDEAGLSGSVTVGDTEVAQVPLYETAQRVGSVFQNPRSQFFCVDTTSEIAFGCENMGLAEDEVLDRIDCVAHELDLSSLLGRSIFKLSGGQKQKIACGSVAAMQPEVFVLDEPSSNLDADAMALLHDVLVHWKNQGKTVIIAEHRLRWLQDVCDRVVVMNDGRVVDDMPMREFRNLPTAYFRQKGLRPLRLSPPERAEAARMADDATRGTLTLHNFRFSYEDGETPALDIDELSLPAHRIVAVIGHNGAGKSTLSHCLCGLQRGCKGTVDLDGTTLKRKGLLKASYLVMQDVNHQLFCESVTEEVRLGMDPAREGDVDEVLERLGLTELVERHPFSLSGGQKQRTAIASALLAGKELLVFDEPTSGLDSKHMEATARLISGLQSQASVFVVSHDPEFILASCSWCLHLEDGKVCESFAMDSAGCARVAEFFGEEFDNVG